MKERRIPALIVAALPILVVVGLALVIGPGGTAQPVAAQNGDEPNVGLTGCLEDVCGNNSCAANDVRVARIQTIDTITPCVNEGDLGFYSFRVEFDPTANTRLDPAVYIAVDGGDALTGVCWMDYLIPPLETTGLTPPPDPLFGPPYWDLNSNDCGDLESQPTFRDIGPVPITCTASILDGTISTVALWSNQQNNTCTATSDKCPVPGSKCRIADAPFDLTINEVDLALTKEVSVTEVPDEREFDFDYTLTVSNEQVLSEDCYTSTGFTISDTLPIWLRLRTEDIVSITNELEWEWQQDESKACITCTNECEGYGDIVTITDLRDLPCGESRVITLPVTLWHGDPYTDCEGAWLSPPEYPEEIDNRACVSGFQFDPNSVNNCDDVSVPTAVELVSFTATPGVRSVVLKWETASETDNLGFNLYRADDIAGERTQVNAELIPTDVPPGSPFGATYAYTDWRLAQGRTYTYWLEDVDIHGNTELHGPVEVTLAGRPGIKELLFRVLPFIGGVREG